MNKIKYQSVNYKSDEIAKIIFQKDRHRFIMQMSIKKANMQMTLPVMMQRGWRNLGNVLLVKVGSLPRRRELLSKNRVNMQMSYASRDPFRQKLLIESRFF